MRQSFNLFKWNKIQYELKQKRKALYICTMLKMRKRLRKLYPTKKSVGERDVSRARK